MRRYWYTRDLLGLLGRDHPLLPPLLRVWGQYGCGGDLWRTDELARQLLVLWRRQPEQRPALVDAAILLGCEVEMLQLARSFTFTAGRLLELEASDAT